MKIAITGATGMIGRELIKEFEAAGHNITILTRDTEKANDMYKASTEIVNWNYENEDKWSFALEGKDVIINLAGANLASKRWNKRSKKILYDSRIKSTQKLVTAIANCENKPKTFISASAVGIYGDRGDELLNEESKPGKDFLANLCNDWEVAAQKVTAYNTRWISLRIGLVLSKDGGVLKSSLLPFKFFIGGKLGNGKQYFPWIHIDDLVKIFTHTIDNDEIKGPLNCASPGIVREEVFAKTLGDILKRPALIPVPRLLLRAAVGEIANAITSGQNISVRKLLSSGYKFKYPELSYTLKNLLTK